MGSEKRNDLNKENMKIRFARPADNIELAELIYITGQDLFLNMFGKKAKNVLSGLSKKENNLFSYEHCKIIEVDESIAGMILGYGFETIKTESKYTGTLIVKHLCINFIFKVFNLVKMDSIISDLKKDDYYISNVAVFKKYRGYGIGKILIKESVKDAKRLNKMRITLDVEDDNEKAIGFYYHIGFKYLKKKTINFIFDRKISLIRMVKSIEKE